MTVTKRQFALLDAMGIKLWCARTTENQENSAEQELPERLEIDLEKLKASQLFNDILLSINLSIAEISCQDKSLNLGLFNWIFSSQDKISFENNLLITPPLETLATRPTLKSQLWQLICEQKIA